MTIAYYLKSALSGQQSSTDGNPVRISISDMRGNVVRDLAGTNEPGINRVQWNLAPNPPPGGGQGRGGFGAGGRGGRGGGNQFITANAVEPGIYLVKLSAGGKELTTPVLVESDNFR